MHGREASHVVVGSAAQWKVEVQCHGQAFIRSGIQASMNNITSVKRGISREGSAGASFFPHFRCAVHCWLSYSSWTSAGCGSE